MHELKNFIAGKWLEGENSFIKYSPFDGQPVARVTKVQLNIYHGYIRYNLDQRETVRLVSKIRSLEKHI